MCFYQFLMLQRACKADNYDKLTHLGSLCAATGLPPVLFNIDNSQKVDTDIGASGRMLEYIVQVKLAFF